MINEILNWTAYSGLFLLMLFCWDYSWLMFKQAYRAENNDDQLFYGYIAMVFGCFAALPTAGWVYVTVAAMYHYS